MCLRVAGRLNAKYRLTEGPTRALSVGLYRADQARVHRTAGAIYRRSPGSAEKLRARVPPRQARPQLPRPPLPRRRHLLLDQLSPAPKIQLRSFPPSDPSARVPCTPKPFSEAQV